MKVAGFSVACFWCTSLLKRPLILLHIMRTTKLEVAPRDAVFGLRSECRENTTQALEESMQALCDLDSEISASYC